MSGCSAQAWQGVVVKVLDGDSIRVQRGNKVHEIRLYGIDAPEYGQPFGNKAKRLTKTLVFKKRVTVQAVDVDKYGRIVALVRWQERLLSQELVHAGLAWVYPKYCKQQPLCREMVNEQSRAKKLRRGLWRDRHPVSPWQWKRITKGSKRGNRR